MKRILLFIFLIVLIFVLTGCKTKEIEIGVNGILTPVIPVQSEYVFLNYEDALKKLKDKSPTQIDNNSILKRGAFIIPKISLVSDSLPNFQITGAPCKKAYERRKQKLWKNLSN